MSADRDLWSDADYFLELADRDVKASTPGGPSDLAPSLLGRVARAPPTLFIYIVRRLISTWRAIRWTSLAAAHAATRCGVRTHAGGACRPSITRWPKFRSTCLRRRSSPSPN